MRTQVVHNTATIRRRFERRGVAVGRELKAEQQGIATDLTGASKAQLQVDVYNVPEAPGSPRTGVLMAEEEWVVSGGGWVIGHRNLAPHYIHRWRYGKPGGRQAVPPRHASSWHRVALARQAVRIRQRRRAAIARAWRRP
jgi:hypothetical protein